MTSALSDTDMLHHSHDQLCGSLSQSISSANEDKFKAFDQLHRKGLKIVHLNIQSITNKLDELKVLLTDLQARISIMAITESWLTDKITDESLHIEGYDFVRRDRSQTTSTKCRGGGVIVYLSNNITFTRRTDLEASNIEMIAVEIKHAKVKPIVLLIVYRPPDSDITNWLGTFELVLGKINVDHTECIIIGDFNVDLQANEGKSEQWRRFF